MMEEVAEAPAAANVMNGNAVPDVLLENMRRGLFGRSADSQEAEGQQNTQRAQGQQEQSSSSADVDDPLKNGISFEDQEELPQKHHVSPVSSPVVEEIPPEAEIISEGESTPIIEEPRDGSVKSPGNSIPEEENSSEPCTSTVQIKITEVKDGTVDETKMHEAFTVPVVIESGSPRSIEVSQESCEVAIIDHDEVANVDTSSSSTTSRTEEKPDIAEEKTEEEEIIEPERAESGDDEEMEVVEEEVTPKASRRSRKSLKDDNIIKTPTAVSTSSRSRRSAPKSRADTTEFELPSESDKSCVKTASETNEQDNEIEEDYVEQATPTTRKNRKRTQKREDEEEAPEELAEDSKDKDEEKYEEEEADEPISSAKSGRKGRATRGKGKAAETKENNEEKKTPRRGTRRVSVVERETHENQETAEEEEIVEPTPKRSSRRQTETKSANDKSEDDGSTAAITPKRSARKGQTKEENETNGAEASETAPEEEFTPRSTRRSTRAAVVKATSRNQKSKKEDATKVEEDIDKNERDEKEENVDIAEGRTRSAAKVEPKTPKSTGRASSRRGVQKKVDETLDDDEVELVKEEGKTPKSRGKKIKTSIKETDETDPYDVDTQFDLHPDPLKNVVVSGGLFGTHKYGKIGSGKYTFTEKMAEERISNLSDLLPRQVNRKSLAELTPGRRKFTPRAPKSAPTRKRKDSGSGEDMDVDQPGSSKASSRKRKTSPMVENVIKKAKEVECPVLNDENQWFVDHPEDEHAPMQIGARVYAVFDKIYYPAIIVAERDGLGRHRVQFVEDDVVRDIPAQGIVPLRAVVAEKECYYGDEGAVIIACPNAASSAEWAKAIFTIRKLDADGEITGNDIKCTWSKLSLDINDWKDYIHQKSLEASSVATDNIAHSRSRRSNVATPTQKPKKSVVKTSKKSSSRKVANENDDNEVEDTEATEEENDRDIFAGMVFLLTSAQRDGNSNFKKKTLVDYIVERKGIIVEDFNDLDLHTEAKPFLISDTYYRTHKYLSALAKGVTCVNHEWIHRCMESESVVDYTEFVLPAGISSVDGREYPAPQNNRHILSGKNLLIYSGTQLSNPKAINYYQIWEPLVSYMGGRTFKSLQELGPDNKLDICLSDNSVTEAMLYRAAKDKAWAVTSEWLINVIIMDRLITPEEFPRFKVQRPLPVIEE